jgi:hypothetical protein
MDFFQDTGGRLLVILLTIPLWWPVMRALWEEINWMLREEGGVFGPIPSERDRASMLEAPRGAEDPLVEEPIISPFERAQAHPGTGPRPQPTDEVEPLGFARSGKIKPPTRFR